MKKLLLLITNVVLNLIQHRNVAQLCSVCVSLRRHDYFNIFISVFAFITLALPSFAYQTVLVDFPEKQSWHPGCYEEQGSEVILQYVPIAQTSQNWTESVIFHSYKDTSRIGNAARLLDTITAQMELKNPSQNYRYTKYTGADSIATRCVKKNAYIPAQCEILRTSKAFEGVISMHYINRNISDFKDSYELWYGIISGIRIYYSYYRDNRILDKATVFEL